MSTGRNIVVVVVGGRNTIIVVPVLSNPWPVAGMSVLQRTIKHRRHEMRIGYTSLRLSDSRDLLENT